MISIRLTHIRRLVEKDQGFSIAVKSRKRHLVEARYIFCLLCRKHTIYTLDQIGIEINRDHSTIVHSEKMAKEFLQVDPEFKQKFNNLERKFKRLYSNNYERFLSKEDKLQNAVMSYIQMQYPSEFVIHVPNEGKRTPFERFKFKYLGGKAGVPDILCFATRGGYSGLAIELKVGYNKPTEKQLECLDRLEAGNWSVHWCNDFDKAKDIIDNYFKYRIDLNV